MADILLVNELVKEMYQNWVSGWIRFGSAIAADDYYDREEYQHDLHCSGPERESCSFYECPLCGGVSCNPLDHVIEHDDTVRLWISGSFLYIAEPGNLLPGGFWDPITIQWKDTVGVRRVDLRDYLETGLASLIKAFLSRKASFAELREAVA